MGLRALIATATQIPIRIFTDDQGLSSIEPNETGDQVNGAEEVLRGRVVAGGNGKRLLLSWAQKFSIRWRAL